MKTLVKNYTFNPATRNILFNDFTNIDLNQVLVITNVTENIIIYNFANPAAGGTINGNGLVLNYDTTGMSETDELQIFVDVPNDPFILSNNSTTAFTAQLLVKSTAGKLYTMTGFNSKESPQYIQIHDSASLPNDGNIPKITFIVPAQANFSLDLGQYGRHFENGIYVCNSSTGATKTLGAADCWFDAQYI